MSDIEHNKAVVARFFQAMNDGDTDTIVASYATDGQLWTMGHTRISGRYDKAQIEAFCTATLDSFPQGIRFRVYNMTAEDDRVAVEAHSEGMHRSGVLYTNEYHFLFILRDGLVVQLKEYMDTERITDILCEGRRPLPTDGMARSG